MSTAFNRLPWLREAEAAERSRTVGDALLTAHAYNQVNRWRGQLYTLDFHDESFVAARRSVALDAQAAELSKSLGLIMTSYGVVNYEEQNIPVITGPELEELLTDGEQVDELHGRLGAAPLETVGGRLRDLLDRKHGIKLTPYGRLMHLINKRLERSLVQYETTMSAVNDFMSAAEAMENNTRLVPLGVINKRIKWAMLVGFPIYNLEGFKAIPDVVERYFTALREKLAGPVRPVVEGLQIRLCRMPFLPTGQVPLDLDKLGAALVSPANLTINPSSRSYYKTWLIKLVEWYIRPGADERDYDEFSQTLLLDISVDPKSYVRLKQLFELVEILLGNNKSLHTFCIILDIKFSERV